MGKGTNSLESISNPIKHILIFRKAGSVDRQMVKNNCPVQTMNITRHNRIAMGHVQTVEYLVAIVI